MAAQSPINQYPINAPLSVVTAQPVNTSAPDAASSPTPSNPLAASGSTSSGTDEEDFRPHSSPSTSHRSPPLQSGASPALLSETAESRSANTSPRSGIQSSFFVPNNPTIEAKFDMNPWNKIAILGISLNGNDRYTPTQVAALIYAARKFRRYTIILHGNTAQCDAWKAENRDNLLKLTPRSCVICWDEFLRKPEYRDKKGELVSYYNDPHNRDFKDGIDQSVDEYMRRHATQDRAQVLDFILEEMAFLIQFAVEDRTDCFVYPRKELTGLCVTKKDFLLGRDRDLLKWVTLSFIFPKKPQKPLLPPPPTEQSPPLVDNPESAFLASFTLQKRASDIFFQMTRCAVLGNPDKIVALKESLHQVVEELEQQASSRIPSPPRLEANSGGSPSPR